MLLDIVCVSRVGGGGGCHFMPLPIMFIHGSILYCYIFFNTLYINDMTFKFVNGKSFLQTSLSINVLFNQQTNKVFNMIRIILN